MFLTTIQSQGLPWPDGTVRSTETVFDFLFCLAEENQNKWLMGIASVREDRSYYAPVSESQGEWVDAQADLLVRSGHELNWYLRNPHAAFELVERLGTCRIGPSLQDRYVAAGHDVIAPPLKIAEQMLATALAALAQNRDAQAFDVATRLLCAEGFRPRARQIRERVLTRFGCFDDAQRECDVLALLAAAEPSPTAVDSRSINPPLRTHYRAVAVELQGLPLDYPAVENHLVRYLYRIDVPRTSHDMSSLPWLVSMPAVSDGSGSGTAAELAEQETWLARTGATRHEGTWEVRGEAAEEVFVAAVQDGLATTDRWGLRAHINAAKTARGPEIAEERHAPTYEFVDGFPYLAVGPNHGFRIEDCTVYRVAEGQKIVTWDLWNPAIKAPDGFPAEWARKFWKDLAAAPHWVTSEDQWSSWYYSLLGDTVVDWTDDRQQGASYLRSCTAKAEFAGDPSTPAAAKAWLAACAAKDAQGAKPSR